MSQNDRAVNTSLMQAPHAEQIYTLPERAQHYPRPNVPMLPLIDLGLLSINRQPVSYSRFLDEDAIFVPSGRIALHYVLQLLNIGKNDEVLVPAYHCGSMLEPIIYHQAKIKFFAIQPDLQINIEQLAPLVNERTRALLLPHFFGHAQPLAQARAFCDKQGIALIEDCAHSFFGKQNDLQLGSVGDFAITSTVKFFPGIEGGALVQNSTAENILKIDLKKTGLSSQLKSVLHTFQARSSYSLLPPYIDDDFSKFISGSDQSMLRPLSANDMHWFEPQQAGMAAAWISQLLATHSDCAEITRRRIENFDYYNERLKGYSGMRPLFTEQPVHSVPYVFPLLIDRPGRVFPQLKLRGVPIWRWEELVLTDCPVSKDYRLKLLQLPCHQSLTPSQLNWIIDTLVAATQASL